MRPAAWALLAVQQHVGLSLHVGRVLPPRVDVREGCSSGRIGQVIAWGSRGSISHFDAAASFVRVRPHRGQAMHELVGYFYPVGLLS